MCHNWTDNTMHAKRFLLKTLGLGGFALMAGSAHALDPAIHSGAYGVGTFASQRTGVHEYLSLLTGHDGYLKRGDPAVASVADRRSGASYHALSKRPWHSVAAGYPQYREVSVQDWMPGTTARDGARYAASEKDLAGQSQAYAMFLAGLGSVGMVVRRRLRSF